MSTHPEVAPGLGGRRSTKAALFVLTGVSASCGRCTTT